MSSILIVNNGFIGDSILASSFAENCKGSCPYASKNNLVDCALSWILGDGKLVDTVILQRIS